MSSGEEYVNRLQEEVRRTLSQHLSGLESDLQTLQGVLSSSLKQIAQKLGPARTFEIPTAGSMLQNALTAATQQRDQDLSFLAHYGHALRGKETQEEILSLLLEGAIRFAGRVALFVARDDRFLGWSARGYSEPAAERLQQGSILQSESPFLLGSCRADALESTNDLSQERILCQLLGDEALPPWHALPLRAIQKPVAVLLAAPDSGRPCDLEALCVIMDLTGLCIENLALKIVREVAEQPVEVPVLEKVQAPAKAAPEPVLESPVLTVEPAVELQIELEIESIEEEPAAPPEPVPTTPRAEVQRAISGDEKLHSDAKRFARLLVSEIKLYNEQRVVEGRAHKDLYLRLKRDIDKSREMYDKRASPIVAGKIDYFHDELIRILGDNDPSNLGSDYPGPRAES